MLGQVTAKTVGIVSETQRWQEHKSKTTSQ